MQLKKIKYVLNKCTSFASTTIKIENNRRQLHKITNKLTSCDSVTNIQTIQNSNQIKLK